MMTNTPQVLVVGGGIGGLCLAHGLTQAGIPVRVAERTRARTDWMQGYRIHIDPHGSRALHACLPASGWARFCAAVSDEAATFSFRTERLAPLLVVDVEQPPRRRSRVTLLQLSRSNVTLLQRLRRRPGSCSTPPPTTCSGPTPTPPARSRRWRDGPGRS
jgi:2-polyprenyl-6-methoxyphenol hydroxylase-like FAD-dependent oxidoreductase